MYEKFKTLDEDALYFLLEDCLIRATDGAESRHIEYVEDQLNRAHEITCELAYRKSRLEKAQ